MTPDNKRADVVLDRSGTSENPNWLGAGGIPAPGERAAGELIVRRIPGFAAEADAWAGRRVLLVGAGHSAETAAVALAGLAEDHPETRVVWAVRSTDPGWGAVADDPLPGRARLAERAREIAAGASPAVTVRAGVAVESLIPGDDEVEVTLRGRGGEPEFLTVDRIVSLTGSVGDHRLYRQLQVHECWATWPPPSAGRRARRGATAWSSPTWAPRRW